VANSRATIFSAKKIKHEICYQDPYVNNQQGRDWLYELPMYQKSTQDKCGVFREEWDPNASKEKKNKKSYVRMMLYYPCNVLSLFFW
jgi:hypothetical protein